MKIFARSCLRQPAWRRHRTAAPAALGGEGKCWHSNGCKGSDARPLRTRARARLGRRGRTLTEKEGAVVEAEAGARASVSIASNQARAESAGSAETRLAGRGGEGRRRRRRGGRGGPGWRSRGASICEDNRRKASVGNQEATAAFTNVSTSQAHGIHHKRHGSGKNKDINRDPLPHSCTTHSLSLSLSLSHTHIHRAGRTWRSHKQGRTLACLRSTGTPRKRLQSAMPTLWPCPM